MYVHSPPPKKLRVTFAIPWPENSHIFLLEKQGLLKTSIRLISVAVPQMPSGFVKDDKLVHIANYSFDRLESGQVCKIYFY